jgi:hypothetical protein
LMYGCGTAHVESMIIAVSSLADKISRTSDSV